jgi:predicted peptidase
MHRRLAARFLVLAFCLASAVCAPAQGREVEFLERTIDVGGTPRAYRVYVPAGAKPGAKLPIVLYLHGRGESGTDNQRQIGNSLGLAIRQNPARFPFIVVFPQIQRGELWVGPPAEMALAALDATAKEFGADPKRVYLTGISLGGYGAWYLAAAHPERFAAVAPVCGGLVPPFPLDRVRAALPARIVAILEAPDPYAAYAKAIGKLPVWTFHGDADRTVPVEGTRRIVAALEANGSPVRYSEYPGVDHHAWERAYVEPDFVEWLLKQ